MNEVFRQEKKYMITLPRMYALRSQMRHIMQEDQHNGTEGYVIRSLYFDSTDDRDYTEKEDGVEVRRKIRLRVYGADSSFASLEMKQKQGQYQKKRSLRLTKEDACALINRNFEVLLQKDNPFANECFYVMCQHVYRPVCIVSYRRTAFIAKENNIRITFDSMLQGTESATGLFDGRLNENPILDPYLAVIEVKYNGFLPAYIKEALKGLNESERAVSKFFAGRSVIKRALL